MNLWLAVEAVAGLLLTFFTDVCILGDYNSINIYLTISGRSEILLPNFLLYDCPSGLDYYTYGFNVCPFSLYTLSPGIGSSLKERSLAIDNHDYDMEGRPACSHLLAGLDGVSGCISALLKRIEYAENDSPEDLKPLSHKIEMSRMYCAGPFQPCNCVDIVSRPLSGQPACFTKDISAALVSTLPSSLSFQVDAPTHARDTKVAIWKFVSAKLLLMARFGLSYDLASSYASSIISAMRRLPSYPVSCINSFLQHFLAVLACVSSPMSSLLLLDSRNRGIMAILALTALSGLAMRSAETRKVFTLYKNTRMGCAWRTMKSHAKVWATSWKVAYLERWQRSAFQTLLFQMPSVGFETRDIPPFSTAFSFSDSLAIIGSCSSDRFLSSFSDSEGGDILIRCDDLEEMIDLHYSLPLPTSISGSGQTLPFDDGIAFDGSDFECETTTFGYSNATLDISAPAPYSLPTDEADGHPVPLTASMYGVRETVSSDSFSILSSDFCDSLYLTSTKSDSSEYSCESDETQYVIDASSQNDKDLRTGSPAILLSSAYPNNVGSWFWSEGEDRLSYSAIVMPEVQDGKIVASTVATQSSTPAVLGMQTNEEISGAEEKYESDNVDNDDVTQTRIRKTKTSLKEPKHASESSSSSFLDSAITKATLNAVTTDCNDSIEIQQDPIDSLLPNSCTAKFDVAEFAVDQSTYCATALSMEDGILADMGEGRSGDETPHQGDSPKRLNNHDRKVEYAANFKLWRAEVKRVRRRAEREAKFIDTVLPFAIRVEERWENIPLSDSITSEISETTTTNVTDESSADQASIPSDEPKLNSHQRKKLKLREQRMVIKAERKAAQQAKKCLNSQFKTTTEGGVNDAASEGDVGDNDSIAHLSPHKSKRRHYFSQHLSHVQVQRDRRAARAEARKTSALSLSDSGSPPFESLSLQADLADLDSSEEEVVCDSASNSPLGLVKEPFDSASDQPMLSSTDSKNMASSESSLITHPDFEFR